MMVLVNRQRMQLCIVVLGAVLSGPAYAACEREDIDYYLGKGFTPAQITAICTQGPATKASETKTDRAPSSATQSDKHQEAVRPEPAPATGTSAESGGAGSESGKKQVSAAGAAHDSNEQFLKTAIEGYDVVLGPDTLSYVSRVCAEPEEGEDLFGFSAKSCSDVKYTLDLNGLEVKSVKKKYTIYGPMVVRVKGKIQREVVGSFKPESESARRMLMDKIDTGSWQDIPIRAGIPVDRVKRVFTEIID